MCVTLLNGADKVRTYADLIFIVGSLVYTQERERESERKFLSIILGISIYTSEGILFFLRAGVCGSSNIVFGT